MTRVKALKKVIVEGREFEIGSVLEIDDDLARAWIKGKYAEASKAELGSKPKPKPKPEAAAVSKGERASPAAAKPRRL